MLTDDETAEQDELEEQLWTATEELQRAVMRLFQGRDIHPHLAALIKARWVCERLHQQLKDELGLDHFEGRSWRGLHHHALLCRPALAFLQHLRRGGEKNRGGRARTAARAEPARRAPRDRGRTDPRAPLLPALPAALRAPPPALKVAG